MFVINPSHVTAGEQTRCPSGEQEWRERTTDDLCHRQVGICLIHALADISVSKDLNMFKIFATIILSKSIQIIFVPSRPMTVYI